MNQIAATDRNEDDLFALTFIGPADTSGTSGLSGTASAAGYNCRHKCQLSVAVEHLEQGHQVAQVQLQVNRVGLT